MLVQSLSHTIVIFSLYFHLNRPPPPRLWTVPLLSYCNSIIKSVNSLRYELSISREACHKKACAVCYHVIQSLQGGLCLTKQRLMVRADCPEKTLPVSAVLRIFRRCCVVLEESLDMSWRNGFLVHGVTRGSRYLHDVCLVLKIM